MTFTDGNTEYNAVASVTCNDGYDLIGSGEIICLNTGIWDTFSADCSIRGMIKFRLGLFEIEIQILAQNVSLYDGHASSSVRPSSTISKIFYSETALPI